MGHSRPQIAKEFRINERTLSWLEQTGRIQLTWVPTNGLLSCDLNEDHKRVLTCAAVSMLALESVTMLFPFHRFLVLRTCQLPADTQYQELIDRCMIHSNVFTMDTLTKHREIIINRLPPLVQRFVQLGRGPESEEEKQWFDCVLDICEVHLAYHHPQLEQSFSFMTSEDIKECIDYAVSTRSTFDEIQKFITDIVRLQVPIEAIAFYQQLFHDINLISTDNLKVYLKMIKPSQRTKMSLAISSNIEVFKIKSGLADKVEVDRVLGVIKDELITDLLAQVGSRTADSDRSINYTLRSLITVLDRIDRIKGPTVRKGPSSARTINVQAQSMESMNIFQLPSNQSAVNEA